MGTRLVALAVLGSCGSDGPTGHRSVDAGASDDGGDAGDGAVDSGADAGGILSGWPEPFEWTLAEPHECPPAIGAGDLLGGLLGDLGLDWTVGIPRSVYDSYGGRIADDPTRLSRFHELQQDVRLVPCFAGNMAGRADAAVLSDHPIATLVADAATQLDLVLEVGGPWPEVSGETPLADALALAGAPGVDASAVPIEMQRAAARVILGAVEAAAKRDEALPHMGDPARFADYFDYGANGWLITTYPSIDPDTEGDSYMFQGAQDGSSVLYQGAVRLAQAVDEADWDAARTDESFELFAETPLGAVLLRGGGDDAYDAAEDPRLAGPLLLLVDAGGNDTYRIPAGANTSAEHGVAVHVDLGGADWYGYDEVGSPGDVEGLLPADAEGRYAGDESWGPFSLSQTGRQGAGLLGYGLLLDLGGGDDTYRSLRRSQGFASFGVGVLWDDGGRDSYTAENGAQGSAVVGVAVFYDGGGDDTYRSYGSSQGFGFVSSFGVLYEAGGDDVYELVVDDVLLFASPQTPGTANSSIGQGCAFGWRRDATRTHLGGGLALLRDRAGNDRYEGSTFVQGAGYWMGMGVLADADGNDRYDGLFYSQGATAHFALAAFLEGAGDDVYDEDRPAIHSSIGLAHDFSVTFFVEDGGADTYFGPDRSLGASKCHGLGILVENGGDDRYEVPVNRAIGWATDWDWAPGSCGSSETNPSYGFFVDAGGDDEYVKPDTTGYGDDSTWLTDDPDDDTAREISGGVDGEGVCFARAYGALYDAGR